MIVEEIVDIIAAAVVSLLDLDHAPAREHTSMIIAVVVEVIAVIAFASVAAEADPNAENDFIAHCAIAKKLFEKVSR